MTLSYNGLGTYDPMNTNQMDLSMGMSPPMAPISTGSNSVQAATQAAVAAAPTTPSGSATAVNPAGAEAGAPMFNPITGEQLNPGFFQKGGGFSIALGALQTLGNLWNSFQQVKVAKDTLKFQKEAYQTNLANFEKDYNTRLESDANYSGQVSGRTAEETAQYVRDHSL